MASQTIKTKELVVIRNTDAFFVSIGRVIMASLLLLFLCAITIQAAPQKDTVVLNLVVETSTLATNQIDNSKLLIYCS